MPSVLEKPMKVKQLPRDIRDELSLSGSETITLVIMSSEELPHEESEVSENKWQQLSKDIREKNYLNGLSQDIERFSREFRDEFAFHHDAKEE